MRRPPGDEVCRARECLDSDDRGQQQGHRSADQDGEVDAPCPPRRLVTLVRDQRIGREGQHLVEDEQREEVRSHRDAHDAEHGEAEADIEARLVRLALAAHIADREHRIDAPEHACHQGEKRAQGFETEGEFEPLKRPGEDELGRRAGPGAHRHRERDDDEANRGDEGQRLAHVRHAADGIGRDCREQRQGERE